MPCHHYCCWQTPVPQDLDDLTGYKLSNCVCIQAKPHSPDAPDDNEPLVDTGSSDLPGQPAQEVDIALKCVHRALQQHRKATGCTALDWLIGRFCDKNSHLNMATAGLCENEDKDDVKRLDMLSPGVHCWTIVDDIR